MVQMFAGMDADASGDVDKEEFKKHWIKMILELAMEASKQEMEALSAMGGMMNGQNGCPQQ